MAIITRRGRKTVEESESSDDSDLSELESPSPKMKKVNATPIVHTPATTRSGDQTPQTQEKVSTKDVTPKKATSKPSDTATQLERTTEFEAETAERRAESRGSKKSPSGNTTECMERKIEVDERLNESDQDQLTHKATTPICPSQMQEKEAPVATENGEKILANENQNSAPIEDAIEKQEMVNTESVENKETTVMSSREQAQVNAVGGFEENAIPRQHLEELIPKEPTLGELISVAIDNTSKKAFTKGDVAIVIDPEALNKTILLQSYQLFLASEWFARHAIAATSGRAIKLAFLLEVDENLSNMPLLRPIDLSQTIEDFRNTEPKPYLCAIQAAEAAATEAAAAKPIKKEENEDGQAEGQHARSDGSTTLPETDWYQAYRSFLSIIVGLPSTRIFNSLSRNNSPALPQIDGVITIAKRFDALLALENMFNKFLFDWMAHQTLYAAIFEKPVSWLLIALAVKNPPVFQEAFRHLVGLFPTSPENDKSIEEIPSEILATIATKSRELRYLRYDVNEQLLGVTVTAEMKPKPKPGQKRYVSQSEEPTMYSTVNLWRDWICDHITYLREVDQGEDTIPVSAVCEHKDGKCLTHAGMYRILSRGADAYLPAEEVLLYWNKRYFNYGADEYKIRHTLTTLKARAAEIVAPLSHSTLQYANKDNLEYLTCVDVKTVDVPWVKDEEDDLIMDD